MRSDCLNWFSENIFAFHLISSEILSWILLRFLHSSKVSYAAFSEIQQWIVIVMQVVGNLFSLALLHGGKVSYFIS